MVKFIAAATTYLIFGGAAIGAVGMLMLVVLAALGVGR